MKKVRHAAGLVICAAAAAACTDSSTEFDASTEQDVGASFEDAFLLPRDGGPPANDCTPPEVTTSNVSGYSVVALEYSPTPGPIDAVHRAAGRLEVGTEEFGAPPVYQRLTVQPIDDAALSVSVLPAAPVQTGELVSLQATIFRWHVRRVTLIELYESSGELLAAYWGASAPLEGDELQEPVFPMVIGPLVIDYEASDCEMIPWWVEDCGLRRMSNMLVMTATGGTIELRPGASVDLPDGLTVSNDPRSYHDAVFTNCFDISHQAVRGHIRRRR